MIQIALYYNCTIQVVQRAMKFKENQTISSQIIAYLKKKIFSGEYLSGDKLPSIRELAIFCKVNPNTIVKVYEQLENEGLVFTEAAAGIFVTLDKEAINRGRDNLLAKETAEFLESVNGIADGQKIIELIKEYYGKF